MSTRRGIATIVALLLLALPVLPLPVARADGGYGNWEPAAMRLHYAGMVKPIDGIPDYTGTFTGPYTMLWTDLYRCTDQSWCCGLVPDGEGTGGHAGVDIRAARGTPVRAVGEGRVIASGYRDDWGNYVIIVHDAVPDAQGSDGQWYGRLQPVTSIYAHLDSIAGNAQRNDGRTKVVRGTIIGYVGSTGRSTGPHLHFQIDRDDNTTPYWPPHGVCGGQTSVNEVRNNTFSPMRLVQAHQVRQLSATGYYYSGTNFETWRGTRYDSAIDFEWYEGPPGVAGVGPDNFSVRWRGTFYVSQPGWYVFFATADDGIRVWLDGEQDANLIINKWFDQPPYTYQAIRYLSAGGHNFRVDYYERGGGATVKVAWKPVSQVLLYTGWEPGQPSGYRDRIEYRNAVSGWYGNDNPPPECSPRYREVWRTGNWAEMIAGRDMSASTNSYCYIGCLRTTLRFGPGRRLPSGFITIRRGERILRRLAMFPWMQRSRMAL